MEFVVTKGQVQVWPVPDQQNPEGPAAGYVLNITDADTGIIFRMSMEAEKASQLGRALVAATEGQEPAPGIHVVQRIPDGVPEPGGAA